MRNWITLGNTFIDSRTRSSNGNNGMEMEGNLNMNLRSMMMPKSLPIKSNSLYVKLIGYSTNPLVCLTIIRLVNLVFGHMIGLVIGWKVRPIVRWLVDWLLWLAALLNGFMMNHHQLGPHSRTSSCLHSVHPPLAFLKFPKCLKNTLLDICLTFQIKGDESVLHVLGVHGSSQVYMKRKIKKKGF